eukprot:336301_1
MSYLNYLDFYTNNAGNRGKITKRGRKTNNWLRYLHLADKVDVYDRHKSTSGWYIGTIVEIETSNDTPMRLKVHYDGWADKFDEWINIDVSKPTSNRIKRLHTITPYHSYLTDSSATPCKWNTRSSQWKRCVTCCRKCCEECLLGTKQCGDCMNRLEVDNIFNAMYSCIYNEYNIDVNIVYLITAYSLGIVIQCSNANKPCFNEMHFDSAFELTKLNSNHFYFYTPKYCRPGTQKIYGKNKRMFCTECSKNELRSCAMENCMNNECGKERTLCHNHHFIRCTVCARNKDAGKEDEISDCKCCGKKHCTDCNVFCVDCKKCAMETRLFEYCDHHVCLDCFGILDNWTTYDDAYDDYTLDDAYDKYYTNERIRKRERRRKGAERTRSLQNYYCRKDNKRKNLKYHNKPNKMLRCHISV